MKTFLLIVIISVSIISCKTRESISVKDDFESDSLSVIWRKDKFIPGAMELQSEIARSGKQAVRLTVRPGDQIAEEVGTIFERAELREPKDLMSVEKRDYTYSFSLFLPSDFPVVETRLVIAQWKQNCSGGNCDPDNPVIALRYGSGEFLITLQTDKQRNTLFKTSEDIRNKWMDFRFDIRFSRYGDGRITCSMNNKEIIAYSGVTAYAEEYGYPEPGNFYFKTGIYRDSMDLPMVIYIDEYSKEELTGN